MDLTDFSMGPLRPLSPLLQYSDGYAASVAELLALPSCT